MYKRIELADISGLFLPISRRSAAKGVYFVRLCSMDVQVRAALWQYHEAASRKGVIIEGQIANPDDRQLSYFHEMMGDAFRADPAFVAGVLEKWMPRMQPGHREVFAAALCLQLKELQKKGKPAGVLKNIYIKMMCWLYYRFERLMPCLGDDDPPRILYQPVGITAHELILLRILSSMGADILLIQTDGDQAYQKQDPASQWSQLLETGSKEMPKDFTLKQFRREMMAAAKPAMPEQRAFNAPVQPAHRDPQDYFPKPGRTACTNAWMKNAAFTEILTPAAGRGDDFRYFYNAFIRVKGVPDKSTFMNELFRFYQQMKETGRKIVIVDGGLELPAPEAAQQIRRHPYHTIQEMVVDLAGNLPPCANVELQRLMQRAFVLTIKEAGKQETNLNRLMVSAVYLLCWIRQYQSALFQGYKGAELPCFILMGGCKNQHDAVFMRYLSKIPVDVLILACDLNTPCTLSDERLLELEGGQSMTEARFPKDAGDLQACTAAMNAEQEMAEVLYGDTGLYRSHQFAKADAVMLQTTYDEIFILWNQEMRYRPGFSTTNQTVQMPVIYARVDGVENSRPEPYWKKIRQLLGDDTRLIHEFPFCVPGGANPFQPLAVRSIRNGQLQREQLQASPQYPFALLREELQQHLLDKLQLMLDRRMIKGTFVNGTEYTVLSTVLNMDKEFVRTLQSFDFTQKNPKFVVLCASQQVCSLQDTILLTFLHLVGCDIVLFVPTGYQTVERYLNENLPKEHRMGPYLYDLQVPDFSTLGQIKALAWLDNWLKR